MLAPNATHSPSAAEGRFRLLTGFGLLLGAAFYVLGGSWDIQWHADVGPDTFFTAPHSMLYGGVSFAGLVALYSLIRTSLRYRAGDPAVTYETSTCFLGLFMLPLGALIAGLGSLTFVIGGLFDLWWHTLYGFDVTLASPPHVLLLLSGMLVLVGTTYQFAGEVTRQRRVEAKRSGLLAAEVGFVLALGSLHAVASSFPLLLTLWNFPHIGQVALFPAVQSLMIGLTLAAALSFLRRPGAGLAIAGVALLWKLGLALVVPGLVAGLADSVHLGYQIHAVLVPVSAFVGTPLLFVPALIGDLMLWAGLRRGWQGWRLALPVSLGLAVGALAILPLDPRWLLYAEQFLDRSWFSQVGWQRRFAGTWAPSLIAAPLIAAGATLLGWRFGQILRYHRQ